MMSAAASASKKHQHRSAARALMLTSTALLARILTLVGEQRVTLSIFHSYRWLLLHQLIILWLLSETQCLVSCSKSYSTRIMEKAFFWATVRPPSSSHNSLMAAHAAFLKPWSPLVLVQS